MPEKSRSTNIDTNGVRLHIVEAGPEDGELVILLHGFPEFWRGWAKQIDPLAEAGYRVVVPDQRGYNLSEKPEGVEAYQLDILAKDILGILSAYNREQAVVVGHDWGAAVAWHIATYYPQVVKKLVILNVPHPSVMMQVLRKSLKQLLKSWYIFFFQIPRFPEWVLSRSGYAAMRRMMVSSSNPGSFRAPDLDYYVTAWSQPGALTAMLNWYRAIFRTSLGLGEDKETQDVRVWVPVLLIWGERDIALSSAMVQPSLALCDDARLVYYEDATHWVQHDQADQVTQEILSFLSWHLHSSVSAR